MTYSRHNPTESITGLSELVLIEADLLTHKKTRRRLIRLSSPDLVQLGPTRVESVDQS